ncbi:MAG: YncE family protein [Acidobacteriota bacterium]|nr:YncE family protein [Acidobacteriota bacterium]
MRKILELACIATLLLAAVAAAGAEAPQYHQVAKFTLGGEGGWDYVVYDPAGDRLFISHNKAVMVVAAADGKVLGEIPADGAHGTALVPDKKRGFLTNGRAGTVTVFDLTTLKPVESIKAGVNPDAIIYDPDSKRVIVMNGRSKDLMVIDPDSLKVVATIPLGGKLEFAAAEPGHIYVNVEDTGEIVSVDSKTWKLDQRWKLAGCEEPSGLALDAHTHHLFSVCGNSKMLVVDTRSGKVVAEVPTGAGTDAAAFDPDQKLAFSSNGEGTLTVVREAKGGKYEVVENDPTQRGARTMALDPRSHKIFTVTAELGPPAEGQRRPSVKPGTFTLLVYAPK